MISNYILKTQIQSIKHKRTQFAAEQNAIEKLLKDLPISNNQIIKSNRGGNIQVSSCVISGRDKLVKQLYNIKAEIAKLNEQLRDLHRQEDAEKNKELMNIFKEIFKPAQIIEIKKEAERRMEGGHPFKLSFNVQEAVDIRDKYSSLKKVSKEHFDKMIEFRILLTYVIENGCKQFGNAEFMKIISPLNRLIIPLEELKRIKVKHLL